MTPIQQFIDAIAPDSYYVLYVGGELPRLFMMSSVMSLLMPVRDVGIFCAHHGFHERMDIGQACFWRMFRLLSRIFEVFIRLTLTALSSVRIVLEVGTMEDYYRFRFMLIQPAD
ncbi:MAG: hypothetical protein SCH70_01885 [Candidatus Methanoperedens sp.]|nr:hypothetical protein [Candidatus Methanoperedens sp.]